MAFGPRALGVDVTDGTLKAVLLSRRGRRVTLHRAWRVGYSHEPDVQAGSLGALETFLRAVRPSPGTHIVLSAPDRGHFSRTYLIPAMEAGRLSEMVRYEVLAELGVPEDDVLVRWHVRRGVVENQVHALALDRRRVEAAVGELRRRRLPFDDLESPGFALASFVEHEQPLGRDRLLLGVGQLATTLVLLREDGLWTRHLALGLQHAEDAEDLATRLADEVDAAVAYLLPSDQPFRPVDLVLTEEGALSGPLTTALKRSLGLPITRFQELARIATPEPVRGGPSAEQVLSMGRALGLALSGLQLGRFRCPVLTGNPARAAARRLPLALVSLALAAAGLLGVTHLATARVAALTAAAPSSLVAEVTSASERAAEARRSVEQRRGVADALSALASRRQAAHAVRRALAVASGVLSAPGDGPAYVESVWLAPTEPGRPGALTLSLHAAEEAGAALAGALPDAFLASFPGSSVRGPEPSTAAGLSRFTVEIPLP